MLHRNSLEYLENWCLKEENRKPLLLRGARQVGKTTLVRLLARRLRLQLVEINLEKPWPFTGSFGEMDPRRTIEAIEFEMNIDIRPEQSIIFFDEVQACPSLLALLRYFREEAPEYRVIATGSLLDFVLNEPEFSIPVGRIDLFYLGPMDFQEFLLALQETKSLQLLENFQLGDTISDSAHQKLNQLVRQFSIVGGMPEAVNAFSMNGSFKDTERIKAGIIDTMRLDFNKYSGRQRSELLQVVFDALPRLIGRKVVYSKISNQYRTNDLAKALQQLCLAGIITKIHNCHANGVPLAAEKNDRYFKVMLLDVGLVLTQLRLVPTEVDRVMELNLVNDGTLAEQFIGQHLYKILPPYRAPELFYWAREKRAAAAEVDFVVEDNSRRVIPVEVKAGSTGSLRSLQVMVREKSVRVAIRFCAAPPSVLNENRQTALGPVDFTLISLPHYLVGQSLRLLSELSTPAP